MTLENEEGVLLKWKTTLEVCMSHAHAGLPTRMCEDGKELGHDRSKGSQLLSPSLEGKVVGDPESRSVHGLLVIWV